MDTTELPDYSINRRRFYSRDEILFCIRSILTNANWVKRIYLVIWRDSQVTTALKALVKSSRDIVKVVHHPDIGLDCTFNSVAIEARLAFIRELSEIFVYLNDDAILLRPVKPRDFVKVKNGKSILQILTTDRDTRDIALQSTTNNFSLAMSNTNECLDRLIAKQSNRALEDVRLDSRYQIAHVGSVTHFEYLWNDPITRPMLEQTVAAPFGNADCIAPTCLLSQTYAVAIGEGEYVDKREEYAMIFAKETTDFDA